MSRDITYSDFRGNDFLNPLPEGGIDYFKCRRCAKTLSHKAKNELKYN